MLQFLFSAKERKAGRKEGEREEEREQEARGKKGFQNISLPFYKFEISE